MLRSVASKNELAAPTHLWQREEGEQPQQVEDDGERVAVLHPRVHLRVLKVGEPQRAARGLEREDQHAHEHAVAHMAHS